MSVPGRRTDPLRRHAWRLGVEHREALVADFMRERPGCERPFLKDVAEELIEEVQGVRLRRDPLPLNVFGQTEKVGSRVMITINTRIPEMEGVVYAGGVANVTIWHESIHAAHDMSDVHGGAGTLLRPFPNFFAEVPKVVVCRLHDAGDDFDRAEFIAEHAGVAAAIAGPDLRRVRAFLEFQRRAARGGEIPDAWGLLLEAAESIGVNRPALVRYLERQGQIQTDNDTRQITSNPQFWKGRELQKQFN